MCHKSKPSFTLYVVDKYFLFCQIRSLVCLCISNFVSALSDLVNIFITREDNFENLRQGTKRDFGLHFYTLIVWLRLESCFLKKDFV